MTSLKYNAYSLINENINKISLKISEVSFLLSSSIFIILKYKNDIPYLNANEIVCIFITVFLKGYIHKMESVCYWPPRFPKWSIRIQENAYRN